MRKLNKLVTLSVLSAIGVVLMSFVKFDFPLGYELKIEVSDIVVLITFFMFGFKEATIVAILKTLGNMMFVGIAGPLAIGQITAVSASLLSVFLMYLLKVNPNNNFKSNIIKSTIIVISTSIIMTTLNYLLITPIYSGKFFWFQLSKEQLNGYFYYIFSTFIPFNLIKASLIFLLFNLIGKRVNDIYLKMN